MRQLPPVGARRGVRQSSSRKTPEPKNITPAGRIKEFPEETFTVANAKLFCRSCREEISLVYSILKGHVSSNKHQANKVSYNKGETDKEERKAFMDDYYKEYPDEAGSSIDLETTAFRWEVVEVCLENGIPLEKVRGRLRKLFEKGGRALADPANLKPFIPKIQKKEIKLIREETAGQFLTITFDGTTRMGEAMSVCGRFVDGDFSAISNRLLCFSTVAKHMDGPELCRHILRAMRTVDLDPDRIVGIVRLSSPHGHLPQELPFL